MTAYVFRKFYAAKWSVLARKRKAGLLLVWLYYIAAKHQLDMTIVPAQKLLQGWANYSISNKTLIQAFSDPNRTASLKSVSWEQVEELIKIYRADVVMKLQRDREKQKNIKAML